MKAAILFIIILTLITWLNASRSHDFEAAQHDCPAACKCITNYENNIETDCQSRGRTSIPPLFPANIEVINFKKNRLAFIKNKTFKKQYHHLKKLNLQDNFISKIEPEAFNNLQSLEYINLSNNRLKDITPELFFNLRKLKHLDLRGNYHFDCQHLKDVLKRTVVLCDEFTTKSSTISTNTFDITSESTQEIRTKTEIPTTEIETTTFLTKYHVTDEDETTTMAVNTEAQSEEAETVSSINHKPTIEKASTTSLPHTTNNDNNKMSTRTSTIYISDEVVTSTSRSTETERFSTVKSDTFTVTKTNSFNEACWVLLIIAIIVVITTLVIIYRRCECHSKKRNNTDDTNFITGSGETLLPNSNRETV